MFTEHTDDVLSRLTLEDCPTHVKYKPPAACRQLMAAYYLNTYYWPPPACRLQLAAYHWPPTTSRLETGRLQLASYIWPSTTRCLRLAAYNWPPTSGRLPLSVSDWPPTTGRLLLGAYHWPNQKVTSCTQKDRMLKNNSGTNQQVRPKQKEEPGLGRGRARQWAFATPSYL